MSAVSSLDDPVVRALIDPATLAAMKRLEGLGRVRRRGDGLGFMLDFGRAAERRRIYGWQGQPFRIRANAEAALLQIHRYVAEGVALDSAIALVAGEKADEATVGRRLDRWLERKREECDAGDLSPSYVRELERWCSATGHIGEFWRASPVAQLTLSGIREWAAWLNRRKGYSRLKSKEPHLLGGKTRHNVHGAMHGFTTWLSEEDRRVHLPKRWPWPSKGDEPAPTIISAETQDAILAEIAEPKRGAFLALAHLGLRPGEAIALDVGDFRDGWLTISKAKKGEGADAPIRGTKTGKVKRLPCTDELRAWIEKRLDAKTRLKGGPLFRNSDAKRSGGRWTSAALRDNWRSACARVGVRVSLYQGTKHSTATHLLAQGAQERHLQALLGHSDVRSTRRYARLADQALVEVLRKRNPTQ